MEPKYHGLDPWSYLSYISYQWQRILTPEIPPERWQAIYRDALQFEEIYQRVKPTL